MAGTLEIIFTALTEILVAITGVFYGIIPVILVSCACITSVFYADAKHDGV
jgi:hypothetical protein